MLQYFDQIRHILAEVEQAEADTMQEVVELLTEANLAKRAIYIFGASHAGIVAEELFYRAGGMMTINPIFARDLMLDCTPITHTSRMERLVGYGEVLSEKVNFQAGDVLIVHSVSGRNPVSIELAIAAKAKGVSVVALTNCTYSASVISRHPSGLRLFEVADIVLDNHGPIGDACCQVGDLQQKVGASSTVIGAAMMNAIIVETCRCLMERGVSYPPIFYSANLDGGDELNRTLFQHYQASIRYVL